MFKYEIGLEAEDKITGFKGTITGRCDYITGCNQYLLQPKMVKTDFKDAKWFDENRLIVKTKKVTKLDTTVDKGACDSAPIK